jgi:hypothetical protein
MLEPLLAKSSTPTLNLFLIGRKDGIGIYLVESAARIDNSDHPVKRIVPPLVTRLDC